MKLAQTLKGKPIEASAEAPKQAVCPCCGGIVKLRSRRTMDNGKVVYFWRHQSNKNQHCSARSHPVR